MPPNTTNTMSLMSSQTNDGLKELWHLQLFPSGSNDKTKAKLRFTISPSPGGSTTTGIQSSSLFVDSDFLDITDNNLINVAVQKSSSGHDITDEHTYQLLIGKTTSDKMKFLNSKSFTIDGDTDSNGNKNFITGSNGRHLFFCNDFTGSVAQIKSWSTPLSFTAFKQHIFNKKSIVGNTFTSSISELQYYYPLQEKYDINSSTFRLIDASTNNKGGDFDLNAGAFTSRSNAFYDSTLVETFNFPNYGDGLGTINTDNMVTIPTEQKLIGNLDYGKSVTRYNNTSERDAIHNRELALIRSPQEIINDFLIDNLGNLDFNDLFADPRDEYKSTYSDLDAFNTTLQKYKISVDMTRFIEATKKIFNSSFVESLKKLLPVKAKVNVGNVIKPTLTDRVKLPPLQERPSFELTPQPSVDKKDFETPVLNSELFTPPEHTFAGFQTPTSSLGAIEPNTIQNFIQGEKDELNVRETYVHNSKFSIQNPQKLWGSSSSDLHFKGLDPGIGNDYNTYHYEEDVVFTSISDTEFVVNTTSSFSGIENTNYTASKTFVNRLLFQTSQTMPKRHMGITQQLYSTSSNESPYGRVLDSNTRIPTNHPAYFQYARYYDKFYQGTKLGRFPGSQQNPGNSLWTGDAGTPPSWSPLNEAEWEDQLTASFYRIEYEDNNINTLRIVRPENTNDGVN